METELKSNSINKSPSWPAGSRSSGQEILLYLLSYFQESATAICSEPPELNTHHHNLFQINFVTRPSMPRSPQWPFLFHHHLIITDIWN